jgi:hypothetical protein
MSKHYIDINNYINSYLTRENEEILEMKNKEGKNSLIWPWIYLDNAWNAISDYILGKDWYIAVSVGGDQARYTQLYYMIENIEDLKKCNNIKNIIILGLIAIIIILLVIIIF